MADETKTEGKGIDTAALGAALGESVKAALKEGLTQIVADETKVAGEKQQANKDAEAQRAAIAKQAGDPVFNLMAPYLAPVALDAQLAIDAATFYSTTGEASSYKDEIERISTAWKQQGLVVPRKDIWSYVQGIHRKEMHEADNKRTAEEQERARLASTVGSGFAGQPNQSQQGVDPYTMTKADLEKALENVSF